MDSIKRISTVMLDNIEKMQALAELVDGKYDEEVTIAMLVSKFK